MERSSKWTYKEPDLTGQGIVGVWPASELSGSISMSGGRLVLTDKALIFCPMDLGQTKKITDLVLTAGQVPGADILTKAAGLSRDSVLVIPLDNIASVAQSGQRKMWKPPTVRVDTKIGSSYEFGVLAGTYSLSGSKENDAAIAEFLAKIQPLIRG